MSNSQSWTAVLAAEAILWDFDGWKWRFETERSVSPANRLGVRSAHFAELSDLVAFLGNCPCAKTATVGQRRRIASSRIWPNLKLGQT